MNQHDSIDRDLEIAIAAAHLAAFRAHLAAFRVELRPFNLKRHPVRIIDNRLMVGDHPWWELRAGSKLTDLLIGIGGRVEGGHQTWAKHLAGERLDAE